MYEEKDFMRLHKKLHNIDSFMHKYEKVFYVTYCKKGGRNVTLSVEKENLDMLYEILITLGFRPFIAPAEIDVLKILKDNGIVEIKRNDKDDIYVIDKDGKKTEMETLNGFFEFLKSDDLYETKIEDMMTWTLD